jgi:hypothetical protein
LVVIGGGAVGYPDKGIVKPLTRKPVRTFLLILWASCLSFSSAAQLKRPDCASPIWSTDVVSNLTGARTASQGLLIDTNRAGLSFFGDQRLAVYEVDLDSELSSRRSVDVSSAFRLHASVLDADTGKLLFIKDWPTRTHNSWIRKTGGGLLVRTGEVLREYSDNFTQVGELALTGTDSCIPSVSPTGNTVMINCVDQKLKVSHFDVLDGTTFMLKYAWTESPPLYHSYSISDTGIATADFNQQHILTSKFGSRVWETFGEPFGEGCVSVPSLVSDNQLAMLACNKLFLSSAKSHLEVLDRMVGFNPSSDKIAVSETGRFAALSLNRIEVKKHLFSEASEHLAAIRIMVYDLYLKRRIMDVEVTPLAKADYDFTLSSNGSKLAILNDRKVTVCPVPIQ